MFGWLKKTDKPTYTELLKAVSPTPTTNTEPRPEGCCQSPEQEAETARRYQKWDDERAARFGKVNK